MLTGWQDSASVKNFPVPGSTPGFAEWTVRGFRGVCVDLPGQAKGFFTDDGCTFRGSRGLLFLGREASQTAGSLTLHFRGNLNVMPVLQHGGCKKFPTRAKIFQNLKAYTTLCRVIAGRLLEFSCAVAGGECTGRANYSSGGLGET